MALAHRPLGASGIEVSAFALGSWRTYERISREAGVAVLQAARDCGIDFLEVARYNDETGRAPIPTGYSEVVFGELFRASDWPRDEVTIATKLWWEFWPRQTAREELAASLDRTGLKRFDFVYCDPPPDELALEEVVAAVGELIADGSVRAWGIVNWPGERVAAAGRIAHDQGVPAPCAAQLPYNLVARAWVEGPEMTAALEECDARVDRVVRAGRRGAERQVRRARSDGAVERGARLAARAGGDGGRRAAARTRRRARHVTGGAGDGLRAGQRQRCERAVRRDDAGAGP